MVSGGKKIFFVSGKAVAELRTDRLFFTQDELAARLGISSGRMSAIEQTKEPVGILLKTFRKLAELAKMEPPELLKRIGAIDAPAAKHRSTATTPSPAPSSSTDYSGPPALKGYVPPTTLTNANTKSEKGATLAELQRQLSAIQAFATAQPTDQEQILDQLDKFDVATIARRSVEAFEKHFPRRAPRKSELEQKQIKAVEKMIDEELKKRVG